MKACSCVLPLWQTTIPVNCDHRITLNAKMFLIELLCNFSPSHIRPKHSCGFYLTLKPPSHFQDQSAWVAHSEYHTPCGLYIYEYLKSRSPCYFWVLNNLLRYMRSVDILPIYPGAQQSRLWQHQENQDSLGWVDWSSGRWRGPTLELCHTQRRSIC